jgi:hypothetical protein
MYFARVESCINEVGSAANIIASQVQVEEIRRWNDAWTQDDPPPVTSDFPSTVVYHCSNVIIKLFYVQ